MISILSTLHWVAGWIVLAEAINKMERCNLLAPGISWHARLVDGLKALAWFFLGLGAGGAIVTPLLLQSSGVGAFIVPLFQLERPTLQDACVLVGFAVLIIRTRVKEG